MNFEFLSQIGFNVWLVWLMFTASVWVTFLGIRFWMRLLQNVKFWE